MWSWLALMKRRDARVLEVPIDWAEVGGSKITPGLDALRMLWGLTRLKKRLERLPEVSLTLEVDGAAVSLSRWEQASLSASTLLSAP
jgi:hypothetical protein